MNLTKKIGRLAQRLLPRRLNAIFRSAVSQVVAPAECSQMKALREFVQPYFDATSYLGCNEDVSRSGANPLEHWLRHGIWEGRLGPAKLEVILDQELDIAYGWRLFTIGDRVLSLRARPDRRLVLQQIMEQAHFEPTVLASGALAIDSLRTYRGDDLSARDGINVTALYEGLPGKVGVLVATPMLVAGGAEKYVTDLVNALATIGCGPIVILVTEQSRVEAQGWEQLKILAPLKGHSVRFWSDAVGVGHGTVDHFARFAQSLRPSVLIVNNSRLALDAIVRFGRGLSQHTRLFCNFFSISPFGLGATYGARYPTLTCAYASSITDNEVMHATLVRMTGSIPGSRVALVPPLAPMSERSVFDKRLASRILRHGSTKQRRWAWVSRVEAAKGTDILRLLALSLPNDQFDVFGPLEQHAQHGVDLNAPNIHLHGLLHDVTVADFTAYDGFIFTSLFEGMPNVVLEMAQHAIPLVLADVGGLSYTFTDGSALLVKHDNDLQTTAGRFAIALERLAAMQGEDIGRMVCNAYERVETRHGSDAHHSAVCTLLQQEIA
ncbi:MAG: hypothetical protein CFE39_10120 [Comamonadaceae bacterium PBBC2]|nr:MAG: hypothetical protein CFE39_10120 [Comamonadaceae bacterium PBBC2]